MSKEKVTYVIAVGDKYVGRNGLGSLEHASHCHTVTQAEGLLRLLRTIRSARGVLDGAVIMARGRERLAPVAWEDAQ